MADRPLDGAVALVTGASSGIGAATARRLAREGAAVALVARRGHRLDRVAGDIAAAGGHAVAVRADITEPERAEDAVQQTLDRLGRLDVLVNNAGIMLLGSALHTSVEEWDRMVSLNVAALLHVTHAAVPHLIYAASTSPRQVADLVNIGAAAGRAARPGSSVYGLTKTGLSAFTESLRRELLGERVRVGLVEPGAVETELVDHLSETVRDASRRSAAGTEALRPEDVADAIGYIVTRERRVAVARMLVRAGEQPW
ncbi:SDR family NAD(P)-dependent oxidoreductase [Actinomadura sp. LD22]|uniref:SDR family NAD(P)-dependent oxidoreductase n=1 Tax=Actinomadura physcomitrii TaxID=2650748 RepID=A0A6I4MHD1_9ACTN|nr:SDR family NAD(P)-dependent oxidoreductase [Actinomadura physcomitrii]MWA03417.1 SDR family NAD(P)-dependent oxidoreductase [Actinomadura physcomitrii]